MSDFVPEAELGPGRPDVVQERWATRSSGLLV